MSRVSSLAAAPALAIAGATVILFTVARIPTEIFYGDLGVQPEDVGLNSVQVLLQGSAVILAICIVAGLAYAVVMIVFSGLYFALLMRISGGKGSARSFLRIGLRLSPVFILVITVAFALYFMINEANEQSASIQDGRAINASFLPWRAEPVDVTWTTPSRQFKLPDCNDLFYLGESAGVVVLYNAANESSYRIPVDHVELQFPEIC